MLSEGGNRVSFNIRLSCCKPLWREQGSFKYDRGESLQPDFGRVSTRRTAGLWWSTEVSEQRARQRKVDTLPEVKHVVRDLAVAHTRNVRSESATFGN